MKITIKKSEDFNTAFKLIHKIFPHNEWNDILYGGVDLWLAYVEGELVGFALATEVSKSKLYLSRSGVLKEYRGLGIQKKLIRSRLRYAKKEGYEKCITYTTTSNFISANNLIKCGFRLYSPEYPWVHGEVCYFSKDVSNNT